MQKSEFIELVAAMRTDQKQFFLLRDRAGYLRTREAERKVDKALTEIEDGGDNFIKDVRLLRATSLEYFKQKRTFAPDRDMVKMLFRQIRTLEYATDRRISDYRDEQARARGMRVVWCVKAWREEVRGVKTVFESSDRREAEIELDDLNDKGDGHTVFTLKREERPYGK